MGIIIAGLISVTVLGGLLAVLLSFSSEIFYVKQDEVLESLIKILPGLNCGSCGYPGCSAYAEALVKGEETDLTKCKPGGESLIPEIGDVLNIEVSGSGVKMQAVVCCGADHGKMAKDFIYKGWKNCEAASKIFRGEQSCKYACLGLGSCVAVCPTNAIKINKQGQVTITKKLCTGCGICVEMCPVNVIELIPYESDFYIACKSHNSGKITRAFCSVGCIGCKICEKKAPNGGFTVRDNLAEIDYSELTNSERAIAAEACPVKCIQNKKK